MGDYGDKLRQERKSELTTKVEEFYNHAHGKGGKFTSGGGSSSGGGGASHEKQVSDFLKKNPTGRDEGAIKKLTERAGAGKPVEKASGFKAWNARRKERKAAKSAAKDAKYAAMLHKDATPEFKATISNRNVLFLANFERADVSKYSAGDLRFTHQALKSGRDDSAQAAHDLTNRGIRASFDRSYTASTARANATQYFGWAHDAARDAKRYENGMKLVKKQARIKGITVNEFDLDQSIELAISGPQELAGAVGPTPAQIKAAENYKPNPGDLLDILDYIDSITENPDTPADQVKVGLLITQDVEDQLDALLKGDGANTLKADGGSNMDYGQKLRQEKRAELARRALPAESTQPIETFAGATKSDTGGKFPAEAYAYVPSPKNPFTWKLRLWATPTGGPDAAIVGAAAAALGKGFRGNKVSIPAADLAGVKAKVAAAWKKANPDKTPADMPSVLASGIVASGDEDEEAGLHIEVDDITVTPSAAMISAYSNLCRAAEFAYPGAEVCVGVDIDADTKKGGEKSDDYDNGLCVDIDGLSQTPPDLVKSAFDSLVSVAKAEYGDTYDLDVDIDVCSSYEDGDSPMGY